MNKKGFISISVVYSFFLVFIAIVLSILAAYSSRRYMLIGIKDDIRNVIDGKTTYSCFSKGITRLNDCLLDVYGGKDYIESQAIPDFSKVTSEGEYGMYATADNLGTSYYLRGDVENNYVQFGQDDNGEDLYWRIVRINGDGTIRLVYDGYSALENGYNNVSDIGDSYYNDAYNSLKYVGYTYDSGSSSQTDSTIKKMIDIWYENNLKDYYSEYLDDGIFCNDRSFLSPNKFASDERIYANNPTLICTNKNDRYTVDDTTNGNGLLKNPVAILSADEIIMAGNNISSASSSYLIRDGIWTMTPTIFENHINSSTMWIFSSAGNLSHYYYEYNLIYFTNSTKLAVRPVINLKADVEIKKGNGTISSPYVIEEEGY